MGYCSPSRPPPANATSSLPPDPNDGTNITGYTADFTNAGGFFTPSFTVTKTGMSVASIDSIRFQFRGAAGDVYIDNVSTTAIPEPSTSALAGLAVLGLAGYRRRRA